MNTFAAGTFFHRYEPDVGHFGSLLTRVLWVSWFGAGGVAIYAMCRATLVVLA